MLSFVVAVSENNIIGNGGSLPWRLPEDLKRFKEITLSESNTMIMGRKTFESLPKILPGRKHIILTNNKNYRIEDNQVKILNGTSELKPYIAAEEEYFVIGGGEIFSILLPYTDKIYLTVIHHIFTGDTFFPYLDKKEWKVTYCREGMVNEDNIYKHTFLTLERVKA